MILSRIRTENPSHLPRLSTSQLPVPASELAPRLPQHEQLTLSVAAVVVVVAALEMRLVRFLDTVAIELETDPLFSLQQRRW